MKKYLKLLVVFCLVSLIAAGNITVYAVEPQYMLSFEEGIGDHLIPENAGIDVLKYNESEKAVEIAQYNIAWAGRFGGCGIKLTELNIDCSAEQNRFLVLSIKVDATSKLNAYDKLRAIFYDTANPDAAQHATTPTDAMTALHGASETEYTNIILDLGWSSSFTLDTLRLDITTSSLDKTAAPDNDNAYNCGKLYLKSAAFFNTLADAQEYINPTPATEEPTPTPTPTPTPEVTPEVTPETTPEATPTPEVTPDVPTGDSTSILMAAAMIVLSLSVILLVKKVKA